MIEKESNFSLRRIYYLCLYDLSIQSYDDQERILINLCKKSLN